MGGSKRCFLDTNLLVYVHDQDEPEKRQTAIEALDKLSTSNKPTISTQVLQEFYVVTTRKLTRPLAEQAAIEAMKRLTSLTIVTITTANIIAAADGAQKYKLNFWDALILEAALVAECDLVLSEDLQHGFCYKQQVQVQDIFKNAQ